MSHINLSKEDFEKLLVKQFQIIYRDLNGDPRKTCMGRGLEINNGWFNILYDLSVKLEAIADEQSLHLKNNPEYDGADTRIVFAQIKEKFGALRVYINNWPEDRKQIEDLVRMAEQQSSIMCEICGEPGKTRSGVWMLTLCDKHHEENQRRIAMEQARYAWNYDLFTIRHKFLSRVDFESDHVEPWDQMKWEDLPVELQDLLAPRLKAVINALLIDSFKKERK